MSRMRERDAALMFLGWYSQLDPERLKVLAAGGRKVARCDCGEDGCMGWAMYWPDDDPEGEVFPVIVLGA